MQLLRPQGSIGVQLAELLCGAAGTAWTPAKLCRWCPGIVCLLGAVRLS